MNAPALLLVFCYEVSFIFIHMSGSFYHIVRAIASIQTTQN